MAVGNSPRLGLHNKAVIQCSAEVIDPLIIRASAIRFADANC